MIEIGAKGWARPYQRELAMHFLGGGKRSFDVWHRKAGKDRIATWIEAALAMQRPGLYWHALPKYEDARKVIWDAITPEGERLIEINFPAAICKKKNAHEMKIELVTGSIWQPVGADNFNSLVGANPVHVTFSEYALMHPHAWDFLRPALAQNNGSALFITTPRGYNHAHELYQHAKGSKDWHSSLLTVNDTGVLSPEILAEEQATMPGELFRQEYLCDWAAANIGSILGRYVEEAENEGRINDDVQADGVVEVSCDIGFRDTAAFWFWEPRYDGFGLVDYDEDTGLDAEDWIERLKLKGYGVARVWLPHDAKAKTFQTRHTVVEKFIQAFGQDKVRVVPQVKVQDRINAARMVMPRCRFHRARCKAGLAGLRSWQYTYDDERKSYSKEPLHDWASHPGDGFSYGALMMQERVTARPVKTARQVIAEAAAKALTYADAEKMHDERHSRRARV